MSINRQVVSFARSRMGQTVGQGECWDLAEEALRSAGGRSSADYGQVHRNSDYVWGLEVMQSSVEAGDILQFRDYRYTIRVTTTNSDGSSSETENWQSRPHHTAVVASVGENGIVEVYEQNIEGRRVVMTNRLYLRSSRTQTRSRGAAVVTQVTVSGTVWCYRPQARTEQEEGRQQD